MVISQYVRLYPNKVAIMLVHRVALVFQQQKSIYNDTDLNTIGMCSENRTADKGVNDINKMKCDVVVITIGCFVNLIEEQKIDFNNISLLIFDECHNATGKHPYCQILQKIECYPREYRPRLVGLSASPFPAVSFSEASKLKNNLKEKFFNATYCKPKQDIRDNCKVIWKKVMIDHYKNEYNSIMTQYLLQITNDLINHLIVKSIIDINDINKKLWSLFIGQMRQVRDTLHKKDYKYNVYKHCVVLINEIFCIVDSFEIIDIIGLHDAIDHIRSCGLENKELNELYS